MLFPLSFRFMLLHPLFSQSFHFLIHVLTITIFSHPSFLLIHSLSHAVNFSFIPHISFNHSFMHFSFFLRKLHSLFTQSYLISIFYYSSSVIQLDYRCFTIFHPFTSFLFFLYFPCFIYSCIPLPHLSFFTLLHSGTHLFIHTFNSSNIFILILQYFILSSFFFLILHSTPLYSSSFFSRSSILISSYVFFPFFLFIRNSLAWKAK